MRGRRLEIYLGKEDRVNFMNYLTFNSPPCSVDLIYVYDIYSVKISSWSLLNRTNVFQESWLIIHLKWRLGLLVPQTLWEGRTKRTMQKTMRSILATCGCAGGRLSWNCCFPGSLFPFRYSFSGCRRGHQPASRAGRLDRRSLADFPLVKEMEWCHTSLLTAMQTRDLQI